MKPYYEEDGITIYHGDCREILPCLPACDLVLTDPPWGIAGANGHINKERGKGDYCSAFTDDEAYVRDVVVPVIEHLRSISDCVVVTPGAKHLSLYPRASSFGCFYQPCAVGMQAFGFMDASPILYYGRNRSGGNMGKKCSYVLTEQPEQNGHPCPKPYSAWLTLLSSVSGPADVILDPFCGSGTTLEAAKNLGHAAIGIEIEEKYCEIAAKRLAQQVFNFGGAQSK